MIKKLLSVARAALLQKTFPVALLAIGAISLAVFDCQAVRADDLKLVSSSFKSGAPIPAQFVTTSPALQWTGAPAGTKSFVIVVHDPDAPNQRFIHWVAYDIPASRTSLPAGAGTPDAKDFKQGKNNFDKIGYNGPAPPPGKEHRYTFTVYALDAELGDLKQPTEYQVQKAMARHKLALARLDGTFKR